MKKFFYFCLSIFVLPLFWSCSTSKKISNEENSNVRYTLVYIIHGDANYTYHLNGKKRKADIDVLNRAIETGRNAKHGEVFIFHQKPERKLLFLIPKKDRTFYHYKNGELVGGKLYSPAGGGLAAEVRLFNDNKSVQTERNVFLYFGHEIPVGSPRLVYHQSKPLHPFNTEIFAHNFQNFDANFDLTVLSTCNNGNPLMA
ncbi:MAG: hypothetical protein R3220_12920, partial [Balneolaceae bacterium]|nr:hypothetical protein [Balneolaceae bacterium]